MSTATIIFTTQGSFDAATSGGTLYGFPFTNNVNLFPSYTNGLAIFTSDALHGFNDAYGKPHIANCDVGQPSSNTCAIASTTSALGLFLGSPFGPATCSYTVNGVAGSATTPAPNSTTFFWVHQHFRVD